LTEEEKKEKLAELRQKMAEKRSKKAEEEAKEQKLNENIRRKAGKVCHEPSTSSIHMHNLPLKGNEQNQRGYEGQASPQRG
jgi:hypothetical protein